MQDNLSIIITMIIFVTLVVIFPLYNLFERQDDMSYTLALKATTTFVDEIRNNGYIDQNSYNDFISQLGNTGNSYDIEIEAHRKTLIADENNPGEFLEQYKIDYNDDILNVINTGTTNISGKLLKDNAYLLNKDDQIYVKLKNSTTTMAGAVFNAIIPTAKKERIVVNYGGVIKNSSWDKVESTIHSFTTRPSAPVISRNGVTISGGSATVEAGVSVDLSALSTPSDWWKRIVSYVWTFQYADGRVENVTTPATGTAPNLVGAITRSFPVQTPSTVSVYAVDNYGETSNLASATIHTYSYGPTKPTLTSNPDTINNNVIIPVAGGTRINFTAYSTVNSTWKVIAKYVWTIQNGGGTPYVRETTTGSLSEVFNNGVGSVTVYAVDSAGLESAKTGTAFSVMNNFAQQAISSVGLATIDSIVINGATVAGYSFEVGVSSGHSGNDWWRIQGLTTGGVWESVRPGGYVDSYVSVSNGVSTGQVSLADQSRYVQLRFQYSVDSGHAGCLTSGSYIKYSVQYKFN
ncbi:MAG: hypothetical protein K0R72_497 [Clostridia bacterium]|jgi:hypothetical protein|nr:hypothetical protein [Clostridia bacterium]